MLAIEPSTRWIVLHRPATNYVTSPTGIRSLQAGDRFTEMGLKSVARVFLAAINNGNLILNSEGAPQIFTWKLNSMKTNLIAGKDKDLRTMTKLNDALCKAYKVPTKNWLTHLVSLSIEAFPDTFKSSIKGASIGSNFRLVGDAIKLNPAHQKLVFDLATSDDFKALCADPFGLAKREAPVASIDPCRSMPSSYDEEIGF